LSTFRKTSKTNGRKGVTCESLEWKKILTETNSGQMFESSVGRVAVGYPRAKGSLVFLFQSRGGGEVGLGVAERKVRA